MKLRLQFLYCHVFFVFKSDLYRFILMFHANCPYEAICMKYQNLFSEKYKQKITNLPFAKFAQKVLILKVTLTIFKNFKQSIPYCLCLNLFFFFTVVT